MSHAMTFEMTLSGARSHRRVGVQAVMAKVAKGLLIALGVVVVLLGILIAPLPGPMGLPISAVGLVIVLKNSYWAKRQFIRVQHARPGWVYPVRRLMRREPEIVPVFWQSLLRMERLLLRKSAGNLKRLRRSTKRALRSVR